MCSFNKEAILNHIFCSIQDAEDIVPQIKYFDIETSSDYILGLSFGVEQMLKILNTLYESIDECR